MPRPLLAMSMAGLLWSTAAYGEPRILSDNELSGATAGLFDTIFVMPIVVVENQQQSVATNQGQGFATTNQVAEISVNNVINAQSINQAFDSSPVIVVQRPLQAPGLGPSAVNFPTWVPWSRELMPFLLGRPCDGTC